MKFTYEGKEYETEKYGFPEIGSHYLTNNGNVSQCTAPFTGSIVMLVRPVEKLHTFGGVEFRETGEVRHVRVGEWFLDDFGVTTCVFRVEANQYTILEPVRIVRES